MVPNSLDLRIVFFCGATLKLLSCLCRAIVWTIWKSKLGMSFWWFHLFQIVSELDLFHFSMNLLFLISSNITKCCEKTRKFFHIIVNAPTIIWNKIINASILLKIMVLIIPKKSNYKKITSNIKWTLCSIKINS